MEQTSENFELYLITCNSSCVADFHDKHLGDSGVVSLCKAMIRMDLSRQITITTLNLWSNDIGHNGALALADMLRNNDTLMELNLNDNLIADSGAEALAEALKHNSSLTDLNLGGNKIGVAGAHALAGCLEVNTTLLGLNLLKNSLGEAGELAFARALLHNDTLTTLRGVNLKKYSRDVLGLPKNLRSRSNRDLLLYKGGFTALHWACLRNDRDLALAIIESGEDVAARSYIGKTPIQVARDNRHFSLANEIAHKYGEKKLLDHYVPMKIDTPMGALTAACSVLVGYADIVTDIFAAALYYSRGQVYYFALSVLFMALPTMVAVLLQKGWGTRLVALCQCALLREVFLSVSRDKEETAMMGTLKLLESVVEACPSSLLQLYILLIGWMQQNNASETGVFSWMGLLPTLADRVILVSIGVSVISTAWTLSYACRTELEQKCTGDKSLFATWICCVRMEQLTDISLVQLTVFVYNFFEVSFRLISVCGLFLAVHGLGMGGLALSFLVRMCIAYTFNAFRDLPQSSAKYRRHVASGNAAASQFDGLPRRRSRRCHFSLFASVKVMSCCLFSLVTDTVWLDNPTLCLVLHILTTLEGAAYFALLVLLTPSNKFDEQSYRSKAFSMLFVAGICWSLKCALGVWRWKFGVRLLRLLEEEEEMEARRAEANKDEDNDDPPESESALNVRAQQPQQGIELSIDPEEYRPTYGNGGGVNAKELASSDLDNNMDLCDMFERL